MRLSDVKGERVFDVLADTIDPMANIASDEDVSNLFKKEKPPEGVSPRKFVLEKLKKAVPALLKGHRDDVVSVLATVEGVTPDEYKESLNLVKLFRDANDLINDEAFAELFISARGGKVEPSSGSAPESTEAQEK